MRASLVLSGVLLVTSAVTFLSACGSGSKSETTTQQMKPVPVPASMTDAKGQTAVIPIEAPGNTKIECSVKGDSRWLEVRKKGNGCELAYTKSGNEGIVASSANGSAHCDSTQTKIKERLLGSGYTCK